MSIASFKLDRERSTGGEIHGTVTVDRTLGTSLRDAFDDLVRKVREMFRDVERERYRDADQDAFADVVRKLRRDEPRVMSLRSSASDVDVSESTPMEARARGRVEVTASARRSLSPRGARARRYGWRRGRS